MLLSVFSFLYNVIEPPSSVAYEFENTVFPAVGLITLLFVIVCALIFYLVLSKQRWMYTRSHWVMTLVFIVIVAAGFAFFQAKAEINELDAYLISFSLYNAFIASVYFFVFSILIKRFSYWSKYVPI